MPVSSAMLQPRLFRESDPPMSRPTCAHLDLDALRHNLAAVRRRAPASRVMAVVKAYGYGHALARVANAFQAAYALARKSVVSGQSVSARLDMGGCRHRKTNTHTVRGDKRWNDKRK